MSLLFLLKRDVSKQFIKYCFIGLGSTILTYLIFIFLLYFLSVNYLISAGAGFISGIFFGFTFNKLYTFRSDKKSAIALPKYFLVSLFSLGFNLIGLRFLVEFIKIKPLISNALLLPIIVLINFFGAKFFVFKNKKW